MTKFRKTITAGLVAATLGVGVAGTSTPLRPGDIIPIGAGALEPLLLGWRLVPLPIGGTSSAIAACAPATEILATNAATGRPPYNRLRLWEVSKNAWGPPILQQ